LRGIDAPFVRRRDRTVSVHEHQGAGCVDAQRIAGFVPFHERVTGEADAGVVAFVVANIAVVWGSFVKRKARLNSLGWNAS
jgi:hypothetical protein